MPKWEENRRFQWDVACGYYLSRNEIQHWTLRPGNGRGMEQADLHKTTGTSRPI